MQSITSQSLSDFTPQLPACPLGMKDALGTTAISDKTHRIIIYDHSVRIVAQLPSNEPPPVHFGLKKKVTHFSDKSRRNLSKVLARVRWKYYEDVYFLTLTYHNDYPSSPEVAKIDLFNFLKSLLYHFPEIDYLWKLEFQQRGAPHFHIIIFFRKDSVSIPPHLFSQEILPLWLQQQGCGCNHCKHHAIRVDRVSSYRKCSWYVQKYIAKDAYNPSLESAGRFWGKSRRLFLVPYAKLDITPDIYLVVRKMVHALLMMRKKVNRKFCEWLSDSWSFEVFLTQEERKILQYWMIEVGIRLSTGIAGGQNALLIF